MGRRLNIVLATIIAAHTVIPIAALLAPQRLHAQVCNDPSGFIKSFGSINLGDLLVMGPDCQHAVDGGSLGLTGGNIVFPEQCGATGDGFHDDAPAIRTCAAQVAANTNGGAVWFSCNRKYRLATRDTSFGATNPAILHPFTNVTYNGCGPSSILFVANGMNTASQEFRVFYPPDDTTTYTYQNVRFTNFTIDENGQNNGGVFYQNTAIAVRFGNDIVVDHIRILNNPGSQSVSLASQTGLALSAISITNNYFHNACALVNTSCTDHSAIFAIAGTGTIIGNYMSMDSQDLVSTGIEVHGLNMTVTGNAINNFSKCSNIAAQAGRTAQQITFNDNVCNGSIYGVTGWAQDGLCLGDIDISHNQFFRSIDPPATGVGYIDFAAEVNNGCSFNVQISNNQFKSSAALGTTTTDPVIVIGQIAGAFVTDNRILNANGPCIGNNGGVWAADTSIYIKNNVCTDVGGSSVASARKCFFFSSAQNINAFVVGGNKCQNVAGNFAQTGFDLTVSTSFGLLDSDNFVVNIATQVNYVLTGFNVNNAHAPVISRGLGFEPVSTAAMTNGQLLIGQTGSDPSALSVSGDCALSSAGVMSCPFSTGSFTPTDQSGAALAFTAATGGFSKMGNMVFAYGRVIYPATASGAVTAIGSLPFAAANQVYAQQCTVSFSNQGASMTAAMTQNTTFFNLYTPTGGNVTNANMSGKTIFFECIYPLT